MSTFTKNVEDIMVECKLEGVQINDVRYIHCTFRGVNIEFSINVLRRFLEGHRIFGKLRVRVENRDEASIYVPYDIVKHGVSLAEIIDALAYMIIGARHCMWFIRSQP